VTGSALTETGTAVSDIVRFCGGVFGGGGGGCGGYETVGDWGFGGIYACRRGGGALQFQSDLLGPAGLASTHIN
jgi:hypothetical protein